MKPDLTIPDDFPYTKVLLKGYTEHSDTDAFRSRHPSMDHVRRAKIFNPFDALEGFSEAVAAKNVLYEYRHILSDDQKKSLDAKLNTLQRLTCNGMRAMENQLTVTVIYFQPCQDKDNFSYGYRGQYLTQTGIVWNVDSAVSKSILVGEKRIPFSDILSVDGPPGLFQDDVWGDALES